MKKLLFLLIVAIMCVFGAEAQDSLRRTEKLGFKPSGLVMADGGVFAPRDGVFKDGVAIPEIRLGGTATYGAWTARAEIGYGFGKLALKDVYLDYNLGEGNGNVRLGYWVQQFGLQSASSASSKCTFEGQVTDMFFGDAARNFGLGYMNDTRGWFMSGSVLCGTKIDKPSNESGRVSVGFVGRGAWHPVCGNGEIVQVGMSGWVQTASRDKETGRGIQTWETTFPTRVDNVGLLGARVDGARGFVKLSPEVLLAKGRFAFEGQYFWLDTWRQDGLRSYEAQGGYGLVRCLLFGERSYRYSSAYGNLTSPVKGTLECVAAYNYTDASCRRSGIMGGVANDVSVTFNYYINKYVTARLRWSYTTVRDRAEKPDRHVNIIQARVQFRF